jgi:hypothetical protein
MTAPASSPRQPAAVPLRWRRFCTVHSKLSMWENVRHRALSRFGACETCGRPADGWHSTPSGPLYCGPQCCPDCGKAEKVLELTGAAG